VVAGRRLGSTVAVAVVLAALPGLGAMSEPAWGPTVTLSTASTAPSYGPADVAVDGRGVATAVWTQGERVLAARGQVGRPWRAPVRVAAGSSAGVGADDRGNVTVLVRGAHRMWAVRRPVGGPWLAPTPVSRRIPPMDPDCNPGPYHGAVAVGSSGAAVAAWEWGSWDCGTARLQAAYRPAGGRWQPARDLATGGHDADVAVDAAGTATVGYIAPAQRVAVVRRVVGRGWTGPRSLGRGGDRPDVSAGERGDVVVSWSAGEDLPYRIHAVRRPAGGPWGRPATVTTAAGYAGPEAVLDRRGRATLAFTTRRHAVATSRAPLGRRWRAPTVLTPTGGAVFELAIAGNGDGAALLGWERGGVRTSYRAARGSWTTPVLLSRDEPESLSLAVARSGSAVAAWADGGVRARWRR
jgi:hypothetical protein